MGVPVLYLENQRAKARLPIVAPRAQKQKPISSVMEELPALLHIADQKYSDNPHKSYLLNLLDQYSDIVDMDRLFVRLGRSAYKAGEFRDAMGLLIRAAKR